MIRIMNIEEIKKEIQTINDINDIRSLNDLKVKMVGKKGLITSLYGKMKELDDEDKKAFGKEINDLKEEFTSKCEERMKILEEEEVKKRLEKDKIDLFMPSTNVPVGCPNILEKLILEVEEVCMSMGYDVASGPEVEEDRFNFELLNIPKGHPARDAQDTFYIKDNELLLRSQTSPVQARVMLEAGGDKPIRIICPGKTYRRDDDDATHSHQFTQIEGLLVDKNISLSDLKGTVEVIVKKLFGDDVTVRFRPSYYQFTEPSVEVDISCFNCGGKGCNICKNSGYITVAGGGIVHPNVLRNCGYDPKKWSGFAFGFGAERLAMLKYGINDIRVFYNNDLRNVDNFNRIEK